MLTNIIDASSGAATRILCVDQIVNAWPSQRINHSIADNLNHCVAQGIGCMKRACYGLWTERLNGMIGAVGFSMLDLLIKLSVVSAIHVSLPHQPAAQNFNGGNLNLLRKRPIFTIVSNLRQEVIQSTIIVRINDLLEERICAVSIVV